MDNNTASSPQTHSTELAEFTFKAVAAGVVLGIVFGSANAYIGLKVGMTVSASIPAAVMTVALFTLFRVRGTILEANLSQTIGSASTALASGTIFTIPALFLWGMAPPYIQVVALCFLGGLLGIAAMIPLRRLLIVDSHQELPYPEGTACAEVLRVTAEGASGGRWIFMGMALAAVIKVLVSVVFLVPEEAALILPSALPKAVIGVELAPALLAVGYILGFRQSGVVVSGAILSALVFIPLLSILGSQLTAPFLPEIIPGSTKPLIADMSAGQIWNYYVRYIGAGAVAAAGIITVLLNLPTMFGAFVAVARGLSGAKHDTATTVERTDRDLPGIFIVGGILLVVLVSGLVPGIFAGNMELTPRLVCGAGVGFFGILFVAVAARIVGIVGVSSNPTSGMTLVTLIGISSLFAAFGWKDAAAQAAVLTVGTIVCVAAGKAGDIAQDLKTGYLVGATPYRQQFGQLIGAAFACWAVAGTVLLLGSVYTFGSKDLPAPQATLMKTIIEGVLSGALPWGLVLSGVGATLSAMLCGVSGLAFAIGVYLPLSSMLPIFIGGVTRAIVEELAARGAAAAKTGAAERTGEPADIGAGGQPSASTRGATADERAERQPGMASDDAANETAAKSAAESESDPGILAASGLVAGEGLAGIVIAALVALNVLPKAAEQTILGGAAGEAGVVAIIAGVCFFLYMAARSRAQ